DGAATAPDGAAAAPDGAATAPDGAATAPDPVTGTAAVAVAGASLFSSHPPTSVRSASPIVNRIIAREYDIPPRPSTS
ncbi:MAG: hypothetical protein JWM53_3587, partial [bacterium]|nr:hypothetical protein [bacterium]